jgi:dihydrofolate reductase
MIAERRQGGSPSRDTYTQGDVSMRKVVLYELLSLDGCAEDPGKQFVPDFDDVMRENLRRVIAKQDAVLLGRRSYDDWAGYWPSSDNQPFANFINNVAKFVVTSSPLDQIWTNTTIVGGELSQFVAELKQQRGGDIGVHGSISLAQSLLEEGLVDELRLVIAPAIHVRGRKLFETAAVQRLTLTRTVTSPTGYLLVDFLAGERVR